MRSSKQNIKIGNTTIEVGHNPDGKTIEQLVGDVREAFVNVAFSFGNAFQHEFLNADELPNVDNLVFAAGDAGELETCINRLLKALEQSQQE